MTAGGGQTEEAEAALALPRVAPEEYRVPPRGGVLSYYNLNLMAPQIDEQAKNS